MVDRTTTIDNTQESKVGMDCPLLQHSIGLWIRGVAFTWHFVFLSPMTGSGQVAHICATTWIPVKRSRTEHAILRLLGCLLSVIEQLFADIIWHGNI